MRYPLVVRADVDPELHRWLPLVKWLLLVPHYIVLLFLWAAFAAVTVAAFVAILCTGRYPRPLFDFNHGVLRWTWRVSYYGYGALGTDRYPPFSLRAHPDFPASLQIDYPQRLSRSLVLVKWWLLAIPHYVFVAVFAGNLLAADAGSADSMSTGWWGLIAVSVLFAAVALLFTGR